MARRKPQNRAQRRKAQQQKRSQLKWLVIVLAIATLAGLVYVAIPKSKEVPMGPQFTRQGSLHFIDGESGDTLREVEIEIKQDPLDRATGMMWRKSLEEHQGMLFIMDQAEPQSFWMRNTYVPLDIIFVDENLRILNIRANAQPESLQAQTSKGDALYVVEVIGGSSSKYGVGPGDKVSFQRDN